MAETDKSQYCSYLNLKDTGDGVEIAYCNYWKNADDYKDIPSGVTQAKGAPRCIPAQKHVNPSFIVLASRTREDVRRLPVVIAEAQKAGCDRYTTETITIRDPRELDRVREDTLKLYDVSPNNKVLTLSPGSTINDIASVARVDSFTEDVVEAARQRTGLPIRKSQTFKDKVERDVIKRGFYGKIKDFTGIVLVNNLGVSERVPNDLFRFLTTFDLHSTGRGKVGSYAAEIAVKIRANEKGYLLLTKTIQQLGGPDALAYIDLLLDDAQIAFEDSRRQALRSVVSAGLPSLGKRR